MNKAKFVEQSSTGAGDDNSNIRYVPNADVISLETMVHILVNKGICTAEELFILEGRVQELNQKDNTKNFMPIQNQFDRGKFPALKRAMSKHHWSRRLGTLLFGWKWKRVKKNNP
jgi:hypothetical protein